MATRWLISEAASQGENGPSNCCLMVLDFKRAFLYADITRDLYIELPDDDSRKRGGVNIGKLCKAMFGTRDAPSAWQGLVKITLVRLGFIASRLLPCLFFCNTTGIRLVAHVDDFLVLGSVGQLQQFKDKQQKEFEVDGDLTGPRTTQTKTLKFLG